MGKNQFLFIVANKMFLMIIDKGETHNYQHNTELPSSFTRIMETKKTFHVPTNTDMGVPDFLVLDPSHSKLVPRVSGNKIFLAFDGIP